MWKRKETSTFGLERESTWDTLRNSLHLIKEEVDSYNPNDIAYVTSGYAPLLARLIETLCKHGTWAGIKDQMRMLVGPTKEIIQATGSATEDTDVTDGDGSASGGAGAGMGMGMMGMGIGSAAAPPTPPAEGGRKKVMMVYFVGGVTFLEISALRFISKQPYCPYEIIVATTKITNGNSLMKSLVVE
jgi:hypothetical protein